MRSCDFDQIADQNMAADVSYCSARGGIGVRHRTTHVVHHFGVIDFRGEQVLLGHDFDLVGEAIWNP